MELLPIEIARIEVSRHHIADIILFEQISHFDGVVGISLVMAEIDLSSGGKQRR